MNLHRLPLRLKLIAALFVPLAVVTVFLGVNVGEALEQRDVAAAQEQEVQRFDAVLAFSNAISRENRAINDLTLGSDALAEARRDGDDAYALLTSPELGLSPDRLAVVNAHRTRLLGLRAALGNDANEVMSVLQDEIATGDTAPDGFLLSVYVPMGELAGSLLGSYDFDEAAIASAETEKLLFDYALVERIRSAVAIEAATYAGLASLDESSVTPVVTEYIATTISDSEAAVSVLTDLGQPAQVGSLDELLRSDQFAPFLELRVDANALVAGTEPNVDAFAAQNAGLAADAGLQDISAGVAAQIEAEASSTAEAATSQLIRSAVVGGGLLVLVAAILILLLRAIRLPLRQVTEQSRRIADVELPEIVRAMRSGDATETPELEEIERPSNDEIGELVTAFNGMQRTAVELAAEQANSRRVVADMFVNLGRRNQKLLNRMLKGLTQLERQEQDPDALEALFKVDQLATRMRRNAESLLILAGASQARTWKEPVPLYDVVQAALAEVENFERVQVDVSDHERVRGDRVADLAHLLAELVENALTFSPPTSAVEIVSRHTERGYVIAITDVGVGMDTDKLDETNARIVRAADQDETPSQFLGMYVVGRLAARHGIAVDLTSTPGGGVTARVVLPPETFDAGDEMDFAPAQPVAVPDAPSAPFAAEALLGTTAPLPQRRPGTSALVADAETPIQPSAGVGQPPVIGATLSPPRPEDRHESASTEGLLTPPAAPAPVGRFGPARRPGAQLPGGPGVDEATPDVAVHDPDDVRTSLAGFQAGTSRADKETMG